MTRPVGILGADRLLGQQFARLVAAHDGFEAARLVGTDHEGEVYGDAVTWRLPQPVPRAVADLPIQSPADLPGADELDLVFSALPTRTAQRVEPQYADRGYVVCSTATNDRLSHDVPLVVPEVNGAHLGLLDVQRDRRSWDGALVKSPAATTTMLALVASVLDEFALRSVNVATLQGVASASGSGTTGMDGLANVVPHVEGEQSRVRTETRRVLGTVDGLELSHADLGISVSTNRVPVQTGTLANVWATLAADVSVVSVETAFRDATTPDLPSAPGDLFEVFLAADRPQPRLDATPATGQRVALGGVEPTPEGVRLDALAHSTIRGGAGNSLLTAELLADEGVL